MDEMNLFAPKHPPIPEEFEKLRHMESFSEEMFNRIVGFQEKSHLAWNTELTFDQRIKDLALHALVFSNPDRDPATMGPTVAHFYPLHDEIRQIAHCAKLVADNPVICDLHARNGFIGSLLAREGVKVIGLRDPNDKQNQILDFYDAACYELREGTINDVGADFSFDVAFSVWMPSGVNVTPQIIKHNPKLIVYIHTDHVDEQTGVRQTGTNDAFTGLPDRYELIAEWSITRPEDFLRQIWPDLSPNIEEIRQVKIYADEAFHNIDISAELAPAEPYDWEIDLDMALTALQAKEYLTNQGFSV